MIVYNNYLSFKILGQYINMFSDETDYGRRTVAEINDSYHYLGDVEPTIQTAILLWEKLNGKNLSEDEIIDLTIEGYSESRMIQPDLGDKMATTKKTEKKPVKKTAVKKAAVKAPATKKAAVKKPVAKKATKVATKPATKKPAKKVAAKKPAAKKPAAKKPAAKKPAAKKAPAKKVEATKTVKPVLDTTGVVTMTPLDFN